VAKKLPGKKKVTPIEHEEVKTAVVHEKREVDGSKTVLKEKGIEQENENNPIGALPEGKSIVGLSKGLTINLGNYESARVSCWISRVANDNEKDIMDNLVQISEMLDEQIQFEVDELTEGRD
jgi:hypothetical protein